MKSHPGSTHEVAWRGEELGPCGLGRRRFDSLYSFEGTEFTFEPHVLFSRILKSSICYHKLNASEPDREPRSIPTM